MGFPWIDVDIIEKNGKFTLEIFLGDKCRKIHWHRERWDFLGTFEQQSHVSYWFRHDVEQVVIRGQILWEQYLHLRELSHKFKHLIS